MSKAEIINEEPDFEGTADIGDGKVKLALRKV